MENTDTKRSVAAASVFSEAMSQILGDDAFAVLDQLGPAKISRLNAFMLQALSTMDGVDSVFDSQDQKHEQKSIAPWAFQPEQGLRFLRLTNGARALAFPLLGVALASIQMFQSGDMLGLPPSLLESAKALWTNVVTLKSPQDDNAIAICHCMLRNGAVRAVLDSHRPTISTTELIAKDNPRARPSS